MKFILSALAASVLAASALGACGGEEKCAVTGMGQKLCGDDLAAWCRATEPLMQSVQESGLYNKSERQEVCGDG